MGLFDFFKRKPPEGAATTAGAGAALGTAALLHVENNRSRDGASGQSDNESGEASSDGDSCGDGGGGGCD